MIRTLRALFLGRLLREKLLLLIFLFIGLLWWLSAFSQRARVFWQQQHATTVELQDQKRWLDNRTKIEAEAQRAAAQLDASKTLDSTRLVNAINQAAYEAGLRNNYGTSGTPQHVSNGVLTVHTVDFQVSGADWDALRKFYLNLHKRAPYIGIESFALSAPNRSNAGLLTLQVRVSSVEVPRG